MLSPRALVTGNPARAKFAVENMVLPLFATRFADYAGGIRVSSI